MRFNRMYLATLMMAAGLADAVPIHREIHAGRVEAFKDLFGFLWHISPLRKYVELGGRLAGQSSGGHQVEASKSTAKDVPETDTEQPSDAKVPSVVETVPEVNPIVEKGSKSTGKDAHETDREESSEESAPSVVETLPQVKQKVEKAPVSNKGQVITPTPAGFRPKREGHTWSTVLVGIVAPATVAGSAVGISTSCNQICPSPYPQDEVQMEHMGQDDGLGMMMHDVLTEGSFANPAVEVMGEEEANMEGVLQPPEVAGEVAEPIVVAAMV